MGELRGKRVRRRREQVQEEGRSSWPDKRGVEREFALGSETVLV